MSIKLSIHQEDWILTTPFRISNAVWNSFPGIVVDLLCDFHDLDLRKMAAE